MNEDEKSTNEPVWVDQDIIVDKGQVSERIDKYIITKTQGITRSKIQNAIKAGDVLVNGKEIKSNYLLRPLDHITFKRPKSSHDGRIIPENIPLNIVFEDEHILVINKQAGLVVHPGHGNYSGTLVNAIAYYLGDDIPTMEGNSDDRIGLVHRIDKDTTGLMVIAKTDGAMSGLAKQFFDHSIERKYNALVWGQPEDEGKVEGNVGRNPFNRIQQTVFPDGEAGKHAVTHYKLLRGMYYVSLVECQLETGRTHQIRVHMKHIGHTLFNDHRYGGDKVLKGTVFSKYKQFVHNCFELFPRQALHAKSLGFIHPISKEKMFFEADLPEDFQKLMEKWENYLSGRKLVKGNE